VFLRTLDTAALPPRLSAAQCHDLENAQARHIPFGSTGHPRTIPSPRRQPRTPRRASTPPHRIYSRLNCGSNNHPPHLRERSGSSSSSASALRRVRLHHHQRQPGGPTSPLRTLKNTIIVPNAHHRAPRRRRSSLTGQQDQDRPCPIPCASRSSNSLWQHTKLKERRERLISQAADHAQRRLLRAEQWRSRTGRVLSENPVFAEPGDPDTPAYPHQHDVVPRALPVVRLHPPEKPSRVF